MAIVKRNTITNDGAKSTTTNKSTGINYVSSYKPNPSKSTYTAPASAGAGPYLPTYTPRNTPTRPNTGSNPTGLNTNASNLASSNNIANAGGTAKTGGNLKSNVYTSSAGTSASTSLPKASSSSSNTKVNPNDYVSNRSTSQGVKNVYQQYGIIPSDTPSNDDGGGSRGRGSNGSSGSSGSGSSGDGNYSSSSSYSSNYTQAEQQKEDIVQKLKDLLAEQERKAKEAYEAQLQEQYAKNKELWRSNADQINLNRARAERFSRNLYGEESGANNTNMARIGAGWASSHNQNNRNLASNDATALSNYNTNLSNAYNTLASGYSNFVLPVYTNRQNYLDELQYRRDANALDYDYRRFLADAGLM